MTRIRAAAVTPFMLLYCVGVLLPLLGLILAAFSHRPEHGAQLPAPAALLSLLFRSVGISLGASLLAIVVAFPLAVAVYFAAFRARSHVRLRALTVLATAMSVAVLWADPLARLLAWREFLRPNGYLIRLLLHIGGASPLPLYTPAAVVVVTANLALPVPLSMLYASLGKLPPTAVWSAQLAGARVGDMIRRVFLPLAGPALKAAFAMTFLLTLSYFITPALIGGGRVETVAMLIDAYVNHTGDFGAGAILAIMMVVLSLPAIVWLITDLDGWIETYKA